MSTRSVSALPQVLLALLIASLLAVAGCDKPVPPSFALRHAAYVSRLDPNDTIRERRDPVRNRVWILGSRGVLLRDRSTGKVAEVPLPSWQWVDEPYGCAPDLAIGPDGEVVVSSNIVPVLWRIDPQTLAVSVHELVLDTDKNKDVGFTQIVYSAQHGVYIAVSETQGSLWQIDPLLHRGWKIAGFTAAHEACSAELP
jgi:uncharacterized protein YbdZ (MbtH family)